jgi:beta-phosphoglucomutase
MLTPDAVFLDFDGVIVDSEPVHEAGLRAVFSTLGMELTPQLNEAGLVGFADRDTYRALCKLYNRTASDAEFEAASKDKWLYVQQAIARGEVPAYKGTLALIQEVKAAGLPLAICSGARRHEIVSLVGQLGFGDALRFIISADDVTNCKPNPEPYATAVARLGVRPERCITVEDTDKGVASAKAAGIRVIAVGHTLPQSRLTQADHYISSADSLSLDLLMRVLAT